MDIRAGIFAAIFLSVIGAFFAARAGIRARQSARKLTFYKLRRRRDAAGWRMLGLGALLLGLAAWLGVWGEPVAYQYFPPSPVPTLTPTASLIPTITLTPSITMTPSVTDIPVVTDTPTITSTPYLLPAIEAQFTSLVTPNPDAVFSPLQFSTAMENFLPVAPATFFRNPIDHMYAVFSYDQMTPGVQWTAVWYRNGEYVHHETLPWNGATGGIGFTDWAPGPDQWLPGIYEVQIFVGHEWKRSGIFTVEGDPPTSTPTMTPTPTLTPTRTSVPSSTPTPTPTPTLSPPPAPT